MRTQCKPISNECNLNLYASGSTPFYCTEAFQGDLGTGPIWGDVYFTDSAMTSNDTLLGIHNPYYFGLAGIEGNGVQNAVLVTYPLKPEIVGVDYGGISFILFCLATIYDIEYDSVNGTITRFVATASNDSVANAWQGPSATISGEPSAPMLQQAANLAIFSNTAQDLADKIALACSRTALALGAQAVMRSPALAAQERLSFLVSRVTASCAAFYSDNCKPSLRGVRHRFDCSCD